MAVGVLFFVLSALQFLWPEVWGVAKSMDFCRIKKKTIVSHDTWQYLKYDLKNSFWLILVLADLKFNLKKKLLSNLQSDFESEGFLLIIFFTK
jgi:hypothetical protein